MGFSCPLIEQEFVLQFPPIAAENTGRNFSACFCGLVFCTHGIMVGFGSPRSSVSFWDSKHQTHPFSSGGDILYKECSREGHHLSFPLGRASL